MGSVEAKPASPGVRVFFAHLRREARGGGRRLIFFVACLAAGVAAVVAVAGFSEGLDRGIRAEARSLLTADLAIRGRQPVPEELKAAVDRIDGAERAQVREMLTMVAAQESAESVAPRSILVELKSVEGGYPFYGDLELELASLSSEDRALPLAERLDERSTVVAPEILARLELEVGSSLKIGGEVYEIVGAVLNEPDRITGQMQVGPRLFVSAAGLERAGLERLGSRVTYRTLVRLPAERQGELGPIAEDLKSYLHEDGRHRIETFSDAQPRLRSSFRRIGSYVSLAALLSLLIGGVGVTQTVRAWLAGRMDSIAVLKCLGYRPRQVLQLYLGQALMLALVGSLVGVGLGIGIQLAAMRLLEGALPVEHVSAWQPLAWGRGLLLGLGVAMMASLPTLAAGSRVPPIRVLRRDAEPLPPSRWAVVVSSLALLASLIALASWQAGSLTQGLLFTGGLLVAAAVLGLAAKGLARLAQRPRGRARLWLRHGLAALGRQGASTTSGIVALGLGVLVLLGMFLVERGLTSELERDLPRNAPSAFLIDIQADQWSDVEGLLTQYGADHIDSVPMVMARIAALDGRRAGDLQSEARESGQRERWALRRELRVTYLDRLAKGNRIVESSDAAISPQTSDGTLEPWIDDSVGELSLEREFAEGLGVGLGARVTLEIQGVEIELQVTSLREVDWGTFGINFFMVAEPSALEGAPQSRLAAARLPEGGEQQLQDTLAQAFPNVTVVRTREMLNKVASTLNRLALGVRLLGGLTVLAGLAILAGAVSAGQVRRGAEVALLKTLGMNRRQVVAAFATEYALTGLLAGLIGSAGATALAWFALTQGMEVPWRFEPMWVTGAVFATVILSVASGLAASAGALRKRPIEVLRNLNG